MTAITHWALGALLLCFQVAGAERDSKQSPITEQEIQQAIEALDSPSFQAREKAFQDLWRLGESAKPALLQLVEKGSLEARGRASRILADIDLGITPDTTVAQTTVLRQFQASSQAQRATTLLELLKRGEMELVSKLIERIDEPRIKRELFRQSFMSTAIMSKLIASRKIEWWIQKAAENDASVRRHEVIVQWLARDETLRQLRDDDNLSIVEDLFAQEPHDASRFSLAKALLDNSGFASLFVKESNIDMLFRVIELPSDAAGSQELLLTLVRQADANAIFQSGTFRKIMQFAETITPANSIHTIKLAFLKRFSSPTFNDRMSVDTFIELCSGLPAAEFDRSIEDTIKHTSTARWMLEADNFRPLLDWAKGLSAISRDHLVLHWSTLVTNYHTPMELVLRNPSTLETYWQLLDAVANEESKLSAKLRFARILATESHYLSDQSKELVQVMLTTQTPAADVALITFLRSTFYRARIFAQSDNVKTHLNRCAQFNRETDERFLIEAYQSIFNATQFRPYLHEPANSQWLLGDYLLSLRDSYRQVAVNTLCNTVAVMEAWKQKSYSEKLLAWAIEQTDPVSRATCVASILSHERIEDNEAGHQNLSLLKLYRDESLPDAARVAFIERIILSQSYLTWLERTDQMPDFLTIAESLAANPGEDTSSLSFSTGYVRLLAKENRLDAWLTKLEGDAAAEIRSLSLLIQSGSLSPEFLDRNRDRLIRITLLVDDLHQRGNYLAEILMSPSALSAYQRQRDIGVLFQYLSTEHHREIQGTLFRRLGSTEVMKVIADSGELDSVIKLVKSLPLERGPSAISLLSNPILLQHLVKTEQVELLFEMISRDPVRSNLQSNQTVIQLLVNHGYVDRLLKDMKTSKEREDLTARVVSSPTAIAYYVKKGQLLTLVELFEQLEAGMTRDSAIMTLFNQPEMAASVCKEIGIERAMTLVNSIKYPYYLASARSNVLMLSCQTEKLDLPGLRQLLVDIEKSGATSLSRRLRLLEGAAGEQLIAAGLLPEVKALFLRSALPQDTRASKSLDQFYSSHLVAKHLIENGQTVEILQHARSITEPQDVYAFAMRLIESDEGCQIFLSSQRFPIIVSIIETLSEYSQSHFWRSFCTNRNVIEYVAYSTDIEAVFNFLIKRKQSESEIARLITQIAQDNQLDQIVKNRTFVNLLVANLPKLAASTQASIASHLSRHSTAIWTLVETDQWDALVAIMECEQTEDLRKQQWRSCASPHGGLISALLNAGQEGKVREILQKSSESSWEQAWTDLWLRASRGSLDADAKAMEAKSESLQTDHWRWLAWAYRAQGNDAKSMEAAIKANGHHFQTALAIERCDWTLAASLLSKAPAPQSHIQPQRPEELELEHQAMLLVTRFYAQQPDQLQGPIKAILDLRDKTTDTRIRSRCCDALMLGEQFETALTFMDQQIVHRALGLRLYQGDYAKATRAVNWAPNDPQAFLTNIRAAIGSDERTMQSAAELLSVLSHQQKHDEMQVLHEAIIHWVREKRRGIPFNPLLTHYIVHLYQYQLYDLFWLTLEHSDVVPLLHSGIFYTDTLDDVERAVRTDLPRLAHWATEERVETSKLQNAITAVRVADQALRFNSVPKHYLDNWVDKIAGADDGLKRYANESLVAGIMCLRQQRLDDARRILYPLEKTHPVASLALARDAWQRKDWEQAAIHYDRLHLKSRRRIEAMYLSGLALTRSGQTEAGDEKMAKALKLAFHPVSQLNLGMELLWLGESESGNNFLRTVTRLTPHHSSTHWEAIRQLKAYARTPEEVLKWCCQWQLIKSRYVYSYGDQAEFLRVPWLLHNALAEQAFLNEDWNRVNQELEMCREVNAVDTAFYSQWIARLEQAGQTDLAEAWALKTQLAESPQ